MLVLDILRKVPDSECEMNQWELIYFLMSQSQFTKTDKYRSCNRIIKVTAKSQEQTFVTKKDKQCTCYQQIVLSPINEKP